MRNTYAYGAQMNLANLETFSEVYRVGSFSAVARQRNVSPSAISRAIASLEADLEVLLFYRTTRKIAPTEAAMLLAEQIDSHLEALRTIRTAVTEARETVAGTLRVSASHSFGIKKLSPLIPEFRAAYPDIKLDLVLTDRMVDIVGDRFDVAIRHGPLPDTSLVATALMQTRYYVCASPEYLKEIAPLESTQALSGLRCLTFPLPGFENVWRFKDAQGCETEVPIRGAMSANSGIILREYALSGDGIVLLSDWLIGEDLASGQLVDLFPKLTATPTNFRTAISAVYPNRKHTPLKVSAFVTFFQRQFQAAGAAP